MRFCEAKKRDGMSVKAVSEAATTAPANVARSHPCDRIRGEVREDKRHVRSGRFHFLHLN